MRLLAALFYIGAGMWLMFRWIDFDTIHPVLPAIIILVLMFSSVIIFNENRWATLTMQSQSEIVQNLDSKGALTRETYCSERALCYEDLNTGSLAYLVDLSDQGILCLYGQYLYDYEPSKDDEDIKEERRFPCDKFTLVRMKKNREIVDITFSGKVFEPEVIRQPHHKKLRALEIKLNDGDVYTHITFDDLRIGLSG